MADTPARVVKATQSPFQRLAISPRQKPQVIDCRLGRVVGGRPQHQGARENPVGQGQAAVTARAVRHHGHNSPASARSAATQADRASHHGCSALPMGCSRLVVSMRSEPGSGANLRAHGTASVSPVPSSHISRIDEAVRPIATGLVSGLDAGTQLDAVPAARALLLNAWDPSSQPRGPGGQTQVRARRVYPWANDDQTGCSVEMTRQGTRTVRVGVGAPHGCVAPGRTRRFEGVRPGEVSGGR
jgi:hypothetical protein